VPGSNDKYGYNVASVILYKYEPKRSPDIHHSLSLIYPEFSLTMALLFQDACNADLRGSIFNDVRGDQYNNFVVISPRPTTADIEFWGSDTDSVVEVRYSHPLSPSSDAEG
jgi:hypothetical protein